jgi:hypothetical protein
MALIQCEECSNEISNLSEKCTYCGFPRKKHTQMKVSGFIGRGKVYISLAVIAVFLFCAYFTYTKYRQFERENLVWESLSKMELVYYMSFILYKEMYQIQKNMKDKDYNMELEMIANQEETQRAKEIITDGVKDINSLCDNTKYTRSLPNDIYDDYLKLCEETDNASKLALTPEITLYTIYDAVMEHRNEFDALLQNVKLKIHYPKENASFFSWFSAQYK